MTTKTKTLILVLTGLILFSLFASCQNVNKDSIVLLTQEQLMEKIRNAYEGDFTCLEYTANDKDKSVTAKVRCTLNGKYFDFDVMEKHRVNNYFYSYYTDGEVVTKYYAGRYETELSNTVKSILDEEFSEVKDKITYRYNGVFVWTGISSKFNTAEEYINSLKNDEYQRVSYSLEVPFAENENKDFELLLKAYDVKWIYVSPVYAS